MTRLLAALLVAAFAASGLFYALATPPGEGQDEWGHVLYVLFLRSEHRLPDPRHSPVLQDHHPPLYPAIGALLWGALERLPLPDAVSLPGRFAVDVALRDAGAPAGPVPLRVLYGLRLLSTLAGALALFLVHRGARAVLGPGSALLATALVACLPGLAFLAGVVNLEILVVATGTGALALLYRWLVAPEAPRARAGVLLGLWAGAAFLSKVSALALAPLLVLAVLLRPALARAALVAAGTARRAAGWGFARNLALAGDPLLGSLKAERLPWWWMETRPLDDRFLDRTLAELVASFVGHLTASGVTMAPVLQMLVAGGIGAAALGAARALARPDPGGGLPSRRVLAFSWAACLLPLALLLVRSTTVQGSQGRYLYLAVLPASVLAVTGLRALAGRRLYPAAAAAALLLAAGAAGATAAGELLPEYWPRRDRLGPGVLAYDDAGHGRLEPHRRAGEDREEAGSASHWRVPERNVTAHPDEVVFAYEGLDPARRWRVRETVTGVAGAQELRADGVLVHGETALALRPRVATYSLPPEAVADGRVTLRWRRARGPRAAVAEVAIEEGGGEGPFLLLDAPTREAVVELPAGGWRVEVAGDSGTVTVGGWRLPVAPGAPARLEWAGGAAVVRLEGASRFQSLALLADR
jgi:hypothetical protein